MEKEEEEERVKFFAFKALRRDMIRLGSEGSKRLSVGRGEGGTGKDTVEEIVGRLREECEKIGVVEEGDQSWVENKVIVRYVARLLSLSMEKVLMCRIVWRKYRPRRVSSTNCNVRSKLSSGSNLLLSNTHHS